MALTPADIHNIVFKRPKPLKRGYDEDEVDEFLDQVETELTRLIEENNDLKRQVRELDAQGSGRAAALVAPDATTSSAAERAADTPAELIAGTANASAVGIRADGERDSGSGSGERDSGPVSAETSRIPGRAGHDDNVQALSVLTLARETADKHVSAAAAEAERARREAREESEQARRQAHEDVQRMIGEAQHKADALHGDARTAAETLHREAHSASEALTSEARRKRTEVMSDLESRRSALQAQIATLRDFEQRFQLRMKSYLERQLHDLEHRDPAEPSNAPDLGAAGRATGSAETDVSADSDELSELNEPSDPDDASEPGEPGNREDSATADATGAGGA